MNSEVEGGPRIALVLATIFLLVVVGGVVDLILDRPTTLFSFHVAFEVLMVTLSLGAAAYLALGWYSTQSRLAETAAVSERHQREREAWERKASELLEGLGSAISEQFDAWQLTPTERKVALMSLKGLSHKRIARLTGTSERTVRQHAAAVYKKADLAGRAELAGFFLEPLLLPEERESGTETALPPEAAIRRSGKSGVSSEEEDVPTS